MAASLTRCRESDLDMRPWGERRTYTGGRRDPSAVGQMYVVPVPATLGGMTNDNASNRGWWVGAAVAVLAAGVIVRELVRSGTVADGLLSHWYGQAGLTAVVLLVAATALYLLHRAYRRR